KRKARLYQASCNCVVHGAWGYPVRNCFSRLNCRPAATLGAERADGRSDYQILALATACRMLHCVSGSVIPLRTKSKGAQVAVGYSRCYRCDDSLVGGLSVIFFLRNPLREL